MEKIDRAKLIGRLYGLAKRSGMDNDMLHTFVFGLTQKESIKELTDKQISFLISKLNGQDYSSREVKKFNQDEYLFHLQEQIREKYNVVDMDAYLNALCEKQFKVKFDDINKQHKTRLVGLLKNIVNRESHAGKNNV
jgi:hypothetical protein